MDLFLSVMIYLLEIIPQFNHWLRIYRFNFQIMYCTLDRKVHLQFLVYWIINWSYLLLYLFFSSVDLATKTERELWWWWEHCQGAKDDGSHGKDQRSWHQSQVSMLSSTMPWLHSAAVPCSPCKDSQRVHVQPNSKGGSRFFFYIRHWKTSFLGKYFLP